jgi:hypothetical protein
MAAIFLAAPLLAGCISQSGVQKTYVKDQDDCRGFAERNIDQYLPKNQPVSVADRNAQMVTLFSDCMGKQGWQVAKPKKADEVASTTAPNGSPNYPNGYPSGAAAATAAAPPPAGAATAAAPSAAATTPAPAGPTQPLQQSAPPPATYQPAYGTGPGRSF